MKKAKGLILWRQDYLKQDISPAIINKAEELTKYYSTRSRGLTKKIKFIIKRY